MNEERIREKEIHNYTKLVYTLKKFGTKPVFDLFYQYFTRDGEICYREIEPHLKSLKKQIKGRSRIILGEKNKNVDMENINLPLAVTIFTTVYPSHPLVESLKSIKHLAKYVTHDLKERQTITDKIFEEKFSQLKLDLVALGVSGNTVNEVRDIRLSEEMIKSIKEDIKKEIMDELNFESLGIGKMFYSYYSISLLRITVTSLFSALYWRL